MKTATTHKIIFIILALSILDASAKQVCTTDGIIITCSEVPEPTSTATNTTNNITNNTTTINIVYKPKEEKKYLGLTKRELIVIGLSVGIGFAIAEYQIRVKPNAVEVSMPID